MPNQTIEANEKMYIQQRIEAVREYRLRHGCEVLPASVDLDTIAPGTAAVGTMRPDAALAGRGNADGHRYKMSDEAKLRTLRAIKERRGGLVGISLIPKSLSVAVVIFGKTQTVATFAAGAAKFDAASRKRFGAEAVTNDPAAVRAADTQLREMRRKRDYERRKAAQKRGK